jgi:hypothetical protein
MCLPNARLALPHSVQQFPMFLRYTSSIPATASVLDPVKIGDQNSMARKRASRFFGP